jgi:hypothetical protein
MLPMRPPPPQLAAYVASELRLGRELANFLKILKLRSDGFYTTIEIPSGDFPADNDLSYRDQLGEGTEGPRGRGQGG